MSVTISSGQTYNVSSGQTDTGDTVLEWRKSTAGPSMSRRAITRAAAPLSTRRPSPHRLAGGRCCPVSDRHFARRVVRHGAGAADRKVVEGSDAGDA